MASSLSRRILVAAIAIPLTLGMVYVGGWLMAAAIGLLGVVGTLEFYRMAQKVGAKPVAWVGVLGAVAFPMSAYLLVGPQRLSPVWAMYLGVMWFLLALASTIWTRKPGPETFSTICATTFAPIYTSALPSFILFLRHGVDGVAPLAATWLVFLPLVMTWICDSFAMTGGSMFGGPKFAPVVSPNKTWSGAASGLVGAVLVAFVFNFFFLAPSGFTVSPVQLVILGVAVGVFGQIGDLAESLLKRSAGTKDSGKFFGEHGGVLDRLDSLYWVLPISSMLLLTFGVL